MGYINFKEEKYKAKNQLQNRQSNNKKLFDELLKSRYLPNTYNLDKEYNKFATLEVSNAEAGDLDLSSLESAKRAKVSFNTKGRGYSGVMKRWNFQGGPGAHGSRFHRAPGSIGNREWPGRVQPGKKMSGHYGNEKVTVQNEIISFDKEHNVLVLKGSIPGFNGAFGKLKIVG